MASVSMAMQAKSDQLNYDDIGNGELIILITEVRVLSGEQPVSIFYDRCNGKPYKPSKGMIRLIASAWGDESDVWVGKSIKLYGDSTVKWAGKEIGGIRIKAFTDINKDGIDAFVALSRGKRRRVHVDHFEAGISKNDLAWVNAVKANPEAINDIQDSDYRDKIMLLVG